MNDRVFLALGIVLVALGAVTLTSADMKLTHRRVSAAELMSTSSTERVTHSSDITLLMMSRAYPRYRPATGR